MTKLKNKHNMMTRLINENINRSAGSDEKSDYCSHKHPGWKQEMEQINITTHNASCMLVSNIMM